MAVEGNIFYFSYVRFISKGKDSCERGRIKCVYHKHLLLIVLCFVQLMFQMGMMYMFLYWFHCCKCLLDTQCKCCHYVNPQTNQFGILENRLVDIILFTRDIGIQATPKYIYVIFKIKVPTPGVYMSLKKI